MAPYAPPIGPIADLLDRIIADPAARNAAKLMLLTAKDSQEIEALISQIRPITASLSPPDTWTRRARPSFLYVMYAIILWAIPMGLVAAFNPAMAGAIVRGMTLYLEGIPDALWTLFGTGYLGYTAARTIGSWKMGKG